MIQLFEKASQSSRPSGQARRGPQGIQMLSGNEFRLRQGFRQRRKHLYAPPGAGREKIGIRFRPRRVRGRKHFSARKRARRVLCGGVRCSGPQSIR